MKKPVAFIGTKYGHDTILQACDELGLEVAGWFDKYYAGNTESFAGYPILGSEQDITEEQYNLVSRFLYDISSDRRAKEEKENEEIKRLKHENEVLKKMQ
jgi:hypothetical protein